ncbi:sugar phosphate isomerase/epimerase family protein [Gemmatimonadota bacterium]
MINRLLLSVSFDEVDSVLDWVEEVGLGLEVTLYDTSWLMGKGALDDAEEIRKRLEDRASIITTHGPLFDLNPGSLDPTIRDYTRECFIRGVEVCAALGGQKIVYHTFHNPLLPSGVLPGWKERSRPVWEELNGVAEEEGVEVCLENSYEPTAEFFADLFHTFADARTRMCFDPAHVHLYSRDGQSAWVITMGHMISHLHLNDNEGKSDDHLALGEGEIPYATILPELCAACLDSTMVLEMHRDNAVRSIRFLRTIGLRE